MQKAAVSVLGWDRPGIVCQVASLLAEVNCNIIDVSQTVLQEEFAGIFLVALPGDLDISELDSFLQQRLQDTGLRPFISQVHPKQRHEEQQPSEPFVVISMGQDRVGLIATITCVMQEYGVNIVNLQFARGSTAFPQKSVTIYEVDIPVSVRLADFVSSLSQRANEVGLEVSVQHKRIFEDICRL
ncbi:MAG: glycine cleavage system protein R [Desulfohalobiaceae bacterium]